MCKCVYAAYFTGTNTTRKVVEFIGNEIAKALEISLFVKDFSLPQDRKGPMVFEENSIVVLGTPTIAGRVPNLLLKYLKTIEGRGCIAVPIVLFGNRNFDNSLIELRDICENAGMRTVAAGAFVGEHSFSKILGKNRPDEEDMKLALELSSEIIKKISSEEGYNHEPIFVDGIEGPDYGGYYMPRDRHGKHIDIRKVKPKTNEDCIDCKHCAKICPMGSINFDNVAEVDGICIKCCGCIKRCPKDAKYFDDKGYIYHKEELEDLYKERNKSVIYY